MVTRIHFDESEQADQASEKLFGADYEVAVVRERFAGEDNDEEIEYVVATTATADQVREVLGDLGDTLVSED